MSLALSEILKTGFVASRPICLIITKLDGWHQGNIYIQNHYNISDFISKRYFMTAWSHLEILQRISPHELYVPWEIFHDFLLSADFFQNQFFSKKFFQKYHLSVKQIGSRSGPTYCRA